MNYTKPEVNVLGQAVEVIESTISKLNPRVPDGQVGKKAATPAYDLDE